MKIDTEVIRQNKDLLDFLILLYSDIDREKLTVGDIQKRIEKKLNEISK